MKKYYDKILLLLGLAVLAIGVGIYYYKGGSAKSSVAPLPPMKLTGSAFEVIPPPVIVDKTADWEAPPDQGDDRNETGWTYSVFTPPKIWWQPGEGWTALPPSGPGKTIPFGIELVTATKDLYRVQVVGIVGAGDANDFIQFTDQEPDYSYGFRLHKGEENAIAQVKVLDMSVDRVEKEHGLIEKVAKVTILDERTNQTVTLVQGEPYSPTNNEYYILHISAPFPDQEWKVIAVGDQSPKLPPNNSFFVVTALDFDKPSVTVEKHSINRKGKEIVTKRELTLVDESAPAPEPAQPAKGGNPAAKPAAPAKSAGKSSDAFAP
jgi:hypothetical protein